MNTEANGNIFGPPSLIFLKRILRAEAASRWEWLTFTITGFTGQYTFPDDMESKTDHVVHICAGSGSVPNYSLLKHALLHMPKLRHTFLYSNRTYHDIIFRDDLARLEASSSGKLRVIHMLNR